MFFGDVYYRKDDRGKNYPQVILCKMKSADALDFYYPGSAALGGQQWTDSSPTPVAFLTSDGKLHIVSKELYVERTNPSSFVGSEKIGIIYCQVIAPQYLRKLLLDKIVAPECDAPPLYQQSSTQPEPAKTWNCANP